jgi:hypothetical protein
MASSAYLLMGKKLLSKFWLWIVGKKACKFSRKVFDSARSYVRMYVPCTGEVVLAGSQKPGPRKLFNWLGPWLFSDLVGSAEHSFAMNP